MKSLPVIPRVIAARADESPEALGIVGRTFITDQFQISAHAIDWRLREDSRMALRSSRRNIWRVLCTVTNSRFYWRVRPCLCSNEEVRIMKNTFAISCLIAGTRRSRSSRRDSDTHRSDPEMMVKDSAITTEIKAKLATEHFSSLAKIHVDTDKNGVVWLSGTAESKAAVDRAIEVAKGTEHVKSVNSTLTVKKDD
jgi:hyperosmotically inducible protein